MCDMLLYVCVTYPPRSFIISQHASECSAVLVGPEKASGTSSTHPLLSAPMRQNHEVKAQVSGAVLTPTVTLSS